MRVEYFDLDRLLPSVRPAHRPAPLLLRTHSPAVTELPARTHTYCVGQSSLCQRVFALTLQSFYILRSIHFKGRFAFRTAVVVPPSRWSLGEGREPLTPKQNGVQLLIVTRQTVSL